MKIGNLIGGDPSFAGIEVMHVVDPATRLELPDSFAVATGAEVDQAARLANQAWKTFRNTSNQERAALLSRIADNIEGLGDRLVETVMAESGLPEGRVKGERGRTFYQLRLFADLVEEGSWVEAVIDTAQPDRQPLPRPDLRKYSTSLGPVAVFTASNFPLAFSTAGGDTASALAAGCPVIVKAHPAHLGTNALVAGAISQAVKDSRLPQGVFSSLQGGIPTGQALVSHPLIKAVGFTGSHQGGMALYRIAQERPEPIPVYAEMGSTNPVFLLPGRMQEDPKATAAMLANSANLGAGQFCTNPGLIILEEGKGSEEFLDCLKQEFARLQPATMLSPSIHRAYEEGRQKMLASEGVEPESVHDGQPDRILGAPTLASVRATDFLLNPALHHEVFGPFSLVIRCGSREQVLEIARQIEGQLTATLLGTTEELHEAGDLFEVITQKAGRVLFNGVPTGVEVCPAMHHGGPFPATTFPGTTSVGTDAIKRFLRPVSFQNAPQELLPDALKEGNPLGIWRRVNGELTRS